MNQSDTICNIEYELNEPVLFNWADDHGDTVQTIVHIAGKFIEDNDTWILCKTDIGNVEKFGITKYFTLADSVIFVAAEDELCPIYNNFKLIIGDKND